jgi:hypothetical protein
MSAIRPHRTCNSTLQILPISVMNSRRRIYALPSFRKSHLVTSSKPEMPSGTVLICRDGQSD